MDLAVQSKGTGEGAERRAVFLSVDQHVLGARSWLCAQPLFTLAVRLSVGLLTFAQEEPETKEFSY